MKKTKNKKGFSFVEMIIAIFIFSLVMVTVSGIFYNIFAGYRNAKAIQKDLEDGQYAINLISKTLRTSEIVEPTIQGMTYSIKAYDYSQAMCVSYQYVSGRNKIQTAFVSDPGDSEPDKEAWCKDDVSFNNNEYHDLTSEIINNASFYFVPSVDNVSVGKVTISMEVCATTSCSGREKDRARIQSTVSLRNY